MKHLRSVVVSLLFLSSCSPGWLSRMYEQEAFAYIRSGVYVQDTQTGLCYFVGNSYRSMSATVVPCDSLGKVLVRHFKFNPKR